MRYLLLLLLLVTPCYAQEFKVNTDLMEIGGLTEVSIVEGKVYSKTPPTSATPVGTISIEPKGSIVFLNYAVDTETKQFVNLKAERTETTLKWTWTQPGKLKVKFTVIDLAKGTGGDQEFDVELKGTKPKPDDPKPDPKPEPNPPEPPLSSPNPLPPFNIESFNFLSKSSSPNPKREPLTL